MTVTVVESAPEPEPAASAEATASQVDPPATEVLETASEAAVTIAAIEADRDVEIATIQADTHLAAMTTERDARITELEAELDQCRTEVHRLSLENIELKERLSSIPAQSTEPEPPPQTNPPGDAAAATPVNQEDRVEAAPPEPVRRKPRLRWI